MGASPLGRSLLSRAMMMAMTSSVQGGPGVTLRRPSSARGALRLPPAVASATVPSCKRPSLACRRPRSAAVRFRGADAEVAGSIPAGGVGASRRGPAPSRAVSPPQMEEEIDDAFEPQKLVRGATACHSICWLRMTRSRM